MNSKQFLVTSILLTGFLEHSECAFHDISEYIKNNSPITFEGIEGPIKEVLAKGDHSKAKDNDVDYDSGTLKDNGSIPPKYWPCLSKAMNSEQFYVELDKLYKLANPWTKNSADLHLEDNADRNGQNPSKLKQVDNIGPWVHETWWIWRSFMSGQVTYVLAQRNKPDLKSTVYDDVLFDNAFNPKLPTKIIIHGFVKNPRSSPIKRAFDWRKSGRSGKVDAEVLPDIEANIIIVDWSGMSHRRYLITRLRMLAVARQTVSLLFRLVVDSKISLDSVDIIGHSMGAQMAGIIGNLVNQEVASRSLGERQVGRITGLDPSLPGFLLTPKNWKLSEGSAKFVQAIHTSDYTYGSARRAGQVDFYVNGGLPTQPGCGTTGAVGAEIRTTIGTALGRLLNFNIQCSHFRAVTYYVESVRRPKAFIGRQCDNVIRFKMGLCNGNPTAYMGEIASRNATPGSYYLNTAAKKPFGLGMRGI